MGRFEWKQIWLNNFILLHFLTFILRAVPFKSTWEGGVPFFYFSVGCWGETIFFYVGWVFFLLVGGSEISGVPLFPVIFKWNSP